MKKRYLFLIILVCLFAVSAVSAEKISNETNNVLSIDTDVSTANEEIVVEQDEILSTSIDDEIISESNKEWYVNASATGEENGTKTNPYNNLQKALDNANDKDIIYIASGLYNGVGNVNLTINKAIVINALDLNVIFDGENMNQIFYINSSNVIINGLLFKNGNSTKGGAIYWEGDDGILNNSTFVNNSVFVNDYNGFGGAIYWEGDNGILNNSYVINNSAICCSLNHNARSKGGAIYWNGENGSVINSTFKNNLANSYSIKNLGHSSEGGTIYWVGYNGTISNSDFINGSTICGNGGSIYSISKKISILNSNFSNNNLTDKYYVYGGAISLNNVYESIIINCSFINNYATSGGSISINTGNCSIIDSKFLKNTGYALGGAIDAYDSKINITNSIFYKNHFNEDSGNGGAIDCSYSTLVLKNCSLIDNGNDTNYGGAIALEYSNASIINSSFNNNTAKLGGAIFGFDNSNISLLNSSFYNSRANSRGGVLYSSDYKITLFISNCDFENNYAKDLGSVFYIQISDEINIINSTFINNTSPRGGAIFLDDRVSGLKIISSVFLFDSIYYGKNIVFNNCWFGNDASNYEMHPDSSSESWLFLEGNSTPMGADGKSNIVFNLNNLYNSSSKLITHPDISSLPDVVFELSSVNGYLNKYFVRPGENVIFTSTNNKEGIVRASIGGFSYSIPIINLKLDAPDVEKYYNGSQRFVVTLSDSTHKPVPNSDVSITIDSKTTYGVSDNDGQFSIPLDLKPGNYTVTTTARGIKVLSTVNIYSTIKSSDIDVIYKNVIFKATFLDTMGKPVSNRKVQFKVGSNTYSATTNANGIARTDIDLNAGKYLITTINPITGEIKTNNIVISKANSSTSISSATFANIATLTANINPSNLSGEVVFTVNGHTYYTEDVINSKASITLNNLNAGNYTAKATYNGDVNHKTSTSNTIQFTIPEYYALITAPDVTKTYGGSEKLEITLTNQDSKAVPNANIRVSLAGKNQSLTTDNKGKAVLDLNMGSGTYTADIFYAGNKEYGAINTTAKVIVNQLSTTTTLSYVNNTCDSVTLTAIVNTSTATGNMVFNVNGKDYAAKISGGKATYKLSDLAPGSYSVKATYKGDTNHKTSTSNTIKFNSPDYVIDVSDVAVDYGVSKDLEITLTRGGTPIANANVNIDLLGKDYIKTTDSEGKAYMPINLNAGSYDAVVSYGDVSATAKVTVNQLSTTTTLSYVNNTYDSVTLTAIVNPSSAGGRVTFNVNGKDYTATVSDAKATYTLNNLAVGSYDAKATYDGDINHKSSSSDNVKFTIEKYSIIVSAPDVTKYYFGPERFVVTVIDNAGNPVFNEPVKVTINGQVYDRKTGADGRTTFAINLRSGSYEATTEHDGDVIKSKITVKTTVISKDVTKIFRNGTNYEASFLDSKGNKAPAGAKVSININGEFYQCTIKDDGSISFDLNLEPGTYVLTLTNPYTGEEISNTVTILPNIVDNKDLVKYYNESKKFSVKVLDSTGNPASGQKVKFTIGNTTYESTSDSNGHAFLNVILQPGTYIVTTIYGDLEVNNTIKILPTLYDKDMQVSSSNIDEGEKEIIEVVLPDDATGKVSTTINGKEYSANVNKGKANIIISDLKYGTYNVDVIYAGDSQYNSVKGKTSFIVDKIIDLSVPDVTKYYGGSERLYVTLKDKNGQPIANAKIKININGVDYDRTTGANGQTSIALGIPAGNYTATVEYNGIKRESDVVIKSTVTGNDITKIYRNGTQYYAKFVDTKGNILKNTPVEFNINGVFYTRTTNENGIAKMNINLNPKEYIITATNPNSGEMHSNVITVLSNIAENHDLTKYYKNSSQYVIRLLDDRGKPVGAGVSVEFNINGVFYTRTSNATGHVKMNINLNPGTYIITANYKGLMTSNTIIVKPILQAKDLNMRYKDGSKFEAKLVDGQGRPFAGQKITFNINGVFYDRTTGDDGIARLNINLMAGQYIITSMYSNGAATSNKVTIRS